MTDMHVHGMLGNVACFSCDARKRPTKYLSNSRTAAMVSVLVSEGGGKLFFDDRAQIPAVRRASQDAEVLQNKARCRSLTEQDVFSAIHGRLCFTCGEGTVMSLEPLQGSANSVLDLQRQATNTAQNVNCSQSISCRRETVRHPSQRTPGRSTKQCLKLVIAVTHTEIVV